MDFQFVAEHYDKCPNIIYVDYAIKNKNNSVHLVIPICVDLIYNTWLIGTVPYSLIIIE